VRLANIAQSPGQKNLSARQSTRFPVFPGLGEKKALIAQGFSTAARLQQPRRGQAAEDQQL
jgi:hypothetical protein